MKQAKLILVALLFVTTPARAGITRTLMAIPSACVETVLRYAGYHGIGPRAFYRNDPRLDGMDPVLVDILAQYATLYRDDYPDVLTIAPGLDRFSPWVNYGNGARRIERDAFTGKHVVNYLGAGLHSSQVKIYSPLGFPLQAQLRVQFLRGDTMPCLAVYIPSPAHSKAFADWYGAWLSVMDTEELAMTDALYYEDTNWRGERDRWAKLFLPGQATLSRWLVRLNGKAPEVAFDVAETTESLIASLHTEYITGDDIPFKVRRGLSRDVVDHLQVFYAHSHRTVLVSRATHRFD